MAMIPIGHGVQHIFDVIAENKRIYDMLTTEERAEVDAHNAKIAGKNITEIIAAGVHPMVRLKEKYKP